MSFEIAKTQPQELYRIFALCNVPVPDPTLPTIYAAQFVRSPVQAPFPAAPRPSSSQMYTGPEPPPPPRKQVYSAQTMNGPMPFEPDSVATSTPTGRSSDRPCAPAPWSRACCGSPVGASQRASDQGAFAPGIRFAAI